MPAAVTVFWFRAAEMRRACNDAGVTGLGISMWLVGTGRAEVRDTILGVPAGVGEARRDVINRTVTEWRLAGCLWWGS